MIAGPANHAGPVIRNTAILAASRLVDKGSSLCLSFFVARQLGPAALGIYSASIVFFGFISLMAGSGCSTFLVREIAKNKIFTNRYLTHLGSMSLALSLGVMVLVRMIVPHLGYSPELAASMYTIAAGCMAGSLKPILEAVFVAHQKTHFIAYPTLAAAALNVGAGTYLLFHKYSIVSLVLTFALSQYFVSAAYMLCIHVFISPLRWAFDLPFAIHMMKEIKAFAGSSILAALFARPEILILSLFKNDAQIGFYSAALRVVDLWQLLPETFMTNVFPVLARCHSAADRVQSRFVLEKSIKYLLAVALPLMTGIFVTARPIVHLLYGDSFASTVLLLRIMSACIPLTFLFEVLWRLLAARDLQNLMLRAQVVSTVARLAGGYVLIGWLGGLGAAISTLSILLLHDLLLAFYVRRDGTELGILRLSGRFSLAALGMAVITGIFLNRSPLIFLIPLAVACYGVVTLSLRGLSKEDFEFFRNANPRQNPKESVNG